MSRLLPLAALALLVSAAPIFAAEKPNIVLIVGDDWGWTDFGFMGSKEAETPHLDKLAAGGAVFPNGYVPTSLCRASLATLLTGQYAHQHKICCNDPPEGVARGEMLPFMKNSPALPRLLKDAGYRSFQTGKFWEGHFSNAGFTDGMTTKGRHGEEGLVIGRQTMKPIYDFIEAGKEPFFLWYAPMMPHLPHNPPERLAKKYQKEGRDPRQANYLAMCEWTDETVGELLGWLDKKGLMKDTLVIFVVDNGWIQSTGMPKQGDQFTTRSKNTPYDGGVRTPVILSWPGHTQKGRYADLVSTVDIAPTVLSVCGATVPKAMPGQNLLPVASGKGKLAREAVFGEIYLHTAKKLDDPTVNLTHRWVRSGDWKLIVPLVEGGKPELYHLGDDPHEKKDLAAEKKEVVERLTKVLETEWTLKRENK